MSNSNEVTLKEAINQLFKAYPFIKDKVNENKITEIWEKAMGKMIAKRTKSIILRKKVLTIEINSASLRNELSYAKEKILKIINAEFEEVIVEEIRIM